MESERRNHFAQRIQEEIVKVDEQVDSLKELTKPIAPDDSIGRLSRMEAIGEKSVNEANLRQLQIRLTQLKSAEQRVQSEDYGLCKECEEEINEKRLELLPESLFCIQCQSKRQ